MGGPYPAASHASSYERPAVPRSALLRAGVVENRTNGDSRYERDENRQKNELGIMVRSYAIQNPDEHAQPCR